MNFTISNATDYLPNLTEPTNKIPITKMNFRQSILAECEDQQF